MKLFTFALLYNIIKSTEICCWAKAWRYGACYTYYLYILGVFMLITLQSGTGGRLYSHETERDCMLCWNESAFMQLATSTAACKTIVLVVAKGGGRIL